MIIDLNNGSYDIQVWEPSLPPRCRHVVSREYMVDGKYSPLVCNQIATHHYLTGEDHFQFIHLCERHHSTVYAYRLLSFRIPRPRHFILMIIEMPENGLYDILNVDQYSLEVPPVCRWVDSEPKPGIGRTICGMLALHHYLTGEEDFRFIHLCSRHDHRIRTRNVLRHLSNNEFLVHVVLSL